MQPEPSKSFWGQLSSGRCVAVIGAGFGRPAGFPVWSEMLGGLLDEAERCGAHHRNPKAFKQAQAAHSAGYLPLVASILKRERLLEKSEYSRVLHAMFAAPRSMTGTMEARLRNLIRAPWAGILTTNYDTLIESHLKGSTEFRFHDNSDSGLGDILADPARFFVKLHGESWKDGSVLSTEDYLRAYARQPFLPQFLRAVMLAHHLVFIGCSLEDELVQLRERLHVEYEGQLPQSYALMPQSSTNELKAVHWDLHASIKCWFYKPTANHGAVDTFLAKLADSGEDYDALAMRPLPPVNARLSYLGFANRMLLHAVLSCEPRGIELSAFADAASLKSRQLRNSHLAIYYSHRSKPDLHGTALRLINLELLSKHDLGGMTMLRVPSMVKKALDTFCDFA